MAPVSRTIGDAVCQGPVTECQSVPDTEYRSILSTAYCHNGAAHVVPLRLGVAVRRCRGQRIKPKRYHKPLVERFKIGWILLWHIFAALFRLIKP